MQDSDFYIFIKKNKNIEVEATDISIANIIIKDILLLNK